ncbi:bestrophin-3-like isoform X1 [Daphnia pulex]|uniref:bestrophin-3-like isoform X1 n=1 Tax=Daphnia pulex TaxID=6669 RepID=UPI001EDCCC5B|nr:bestrophin-3-like isoform X1 [Daphnia pulex]
MVNYYDDMASVKQMCQTCSLLFRWQGSIYKILWRQVLMYFVTYIALGLLYKLALNEDDQRTFEKIALCCAKYADSIPVVLFLGFFTGTVMQRWWAVYAAIPGTGKIITLATFYMKRDNAQSSKWLRTLTRYLILAWMMCMRTTCRPLRNKYPTLESMQRAGFLLKHEAEILSLEQEESHKWSLRVINWALILVRQGRDEGLFENPGDATRLLDPIVAFKKSCSVVLKYQITAIPLSFVQAVTLTVQIFGLVSLMGKQFVDFPTKLLVIDCYLPILPAMQYLAYLSWLKLGEVAVNPFGEDDDDFDIIGLFENHVELAGDLLQLFELDHKNPVKESLEQTSFTLFKLEESNLRKLPEVPAEAAIHTEEDIPFMAYNPLPQMSMSLLEYGFFNRGTAE